LNYYFIYGPELTSIAQQYMHLTGKPELPPKWALGFHQCRWSYYPESRVIELADTFRKMKIPCDSIYLDIDYMQGYRCFTWNHKYFPNPKKMLGNLSKKGFHTVVMIDPGLKSDDPDYWVYQEGLKKDAFCKRPDGELMKGPVWPSECVFPDYTNPKVRDWWGSLYKELYNEQGISGFWNDMNEPAVFSVNTKTFPEDVRHDYDGLQKSHKAAHNIYGMQMSRASVEGLKKLQPKKRPFLLTRATFSGGQRYAAVWTGDNHSDWGHLRTANRQCQRLSISGFSLVGSDVGGFAGQPDGELMVRWLQLAAFHPVYRVHSIGNNIDGAVQVEGEEIAKLEAANRLDQEPWAYGEPFTKYARQAIELRYRLIAYLYSAMQQCCTVGTPVIRSLVFYDQSDEKAMKTQRDFMFGEKLLVSPIMRPGQHEQTIYFPKGNWYGLEDGQLYKGKRKHMIKVELKDIPVFAKAGSAIAMYPVQQHTNELAFKEMTLHTFFCKGTETTELYEDAGEGYDYQKEGGFSLKTFTCTGDVDSFVIAQSVTGKYKRGYTKVKVKIAGIPFPVTACTVDGKAVKYEVVEHWLDLEVGLGFGEIRVG
jgi:alpha-glucosidase